MALIRRGEVGQLSQILIPLVVVAVLGIAFSLIMADIGTNYSVDTSTDSANQIVAQSNKISNLSTDLSRSVIDSDTTSTNILTSSERLFSGAYNSILLIGAVPGMYSAIISEIASTLKIPSAILNMILAAVIFAIIGTVIYLILGRR